MRIVLDTNVALSALMWRGTPYRLLQAIRDRIDSQLVASAPLLEELADVLQRPSPARRLALAGKTGSEVLADYTAIVEIVSPLDVPRVVAADPDDGHVVAAAVAGGADLIVSGDADLLSLGSHRGIAIVDPAHALQRVSVD